LFESGEAPYDANARLRGHVTSPEPTVLVVGLGDLGTRVLGGLAREGSIGRLVGASRDVDRGRALTAQAALKAQLLGGPEVVGHERVELEDVEATARVLRTLDPQVVVTAASYHTWWRAPNMLPYAAWLPLHLRPVRRLMEAVSAAGSAARVVCLPFPDVVGPVLAGIGLAPHLGAGNVAEVAAKLRLLAGRAHGASRRDVEVRLVMHHAAERVALGAFASLGGADDPDGEPPWTAEVRVRGERLEAAAVADLFTSPYALPSGRETHGLTSAATVALVCALLGDEPCAVHAPAVGGRPGGYPARVSASVVELDLPAAMDEAEAVAINERAARWDGIEAIEPDGTVVYTRAAADACEAAFGTRVERLAPSDQDAAAEALRARQDGAATAVAD
jgi:hypothetical protein